MQPTFLRHLALSLLGASTARALSFVMIPLAARLYGRDDFGGLALFLGFVGLVQPFLTLRYEIAVVLARSSRAARALVCGVLGIALVGYAIVALLVMTAPSLLGHIVDPRLIASLRAAVLLHLAGVVLNALLTAWLQRHRAFGIIALSQVAGALVTAVLVLGAPQIVDPSLPLLVWAYALGVLSSTLVLAIGSAGTGVSLFERAPQVQRIIPLLKKYRVYPMFSLPLTLSGLASDRTLLLYLSSVFSLGTLGGFFSARQLLFGLVHLTTSSVNQVVFPYVYQSEKGVASSKGPLLAIAKSIAVAAGFGLGWLLLYSTEVTLILFGHEWLDVAPIVPWIAAQAAVWSVVGWQGRLLDVERRQKLDVMLQMAGDLALIAVIVVLFLFEATVTVAVAIVSLIGIAHSMLWLVIAYRVTRLGVGQALACAVLLVASAAAAAGLALVCKEVLGAAVGSAVSLTVSALGMAATIAVTARSIHRDVAWQAGPVRQSPRPNPMSGRSVSTVQVKSRRCAQVYGKPA